MCKKLDADKVKDIKDKINNSIRTLGNIAILTTQSDDVKTVVDLSNSIQLQG